LDGQVAAFEIALARREAGEPVAVLTGCAPGLWPPPRMRALVLLFPGPVLAGPAPLVRSLRAQRVIEAAHPAYEHFLVWMFAVSPARHRRGIGGRLMREALSQENKVGIAKVSFRDKEHLAALRFKDNVFVLETMFWPDEIRAADFEELDKKVNVRLQEIQMAKSLIESLTDEFKPEQFRDEYREALLGIIGKKVSGEEIEVIPEAEPTKVVDLMEALKASVAAQKQKKQAAPQAKSKKSTARPKKAAAG